MKLVTRNTYYLLIVYFSIFLLVVIPFYYVVNHIIQEEFDKTLYQRKHLLIQQLSMSDSIINYQKFSDNRMDVRESNVPLSSFERINDTVIFDQNDKTYFKYRQIHFTQKIRGHYYVIYSRKLLAEKENLARALLVLTVFLFLILLITLFFLNRKFNHQVWKPFYVTLDRLKKYQLQQKEDVSIVTTNIDEFDELNEAIGIMLHRIRKDFYLLKEVTENTSHELQTPLAVIKSKLELLLQADNLTDLQYKHLDASLASVNKLSKLNDSLGLLTKIENSQFNHYEKINIGQLIDNKLFNYEDLLKIKCIKLIKENYGTSEIKMNPILADILIENLINNAIKHTSINGEIIINIKSNEVRISNTGQALTVDPLLLFKRFSKSNSQSFGLGLSIVKEICDQNRIKISYKYEEDYHWHTITLLF